MQFEHRAELIDRKTLVETFVNIGPLFALLSSRNHQIVYGRRGTGKTHALLFLTEHLESEGDVAVYVDLRNIGSTGGVYADSALPLTERATRLLQDTLSNLHDELRKAIIAAPNSFDLSVFGPLLDALAAEITSVVVVGNTSVTHESTESATSEDAAGASVALGGKGILNVSLNDRHAQDHSVCDKSIVIRSGDTRHRVHFGALRNALSALVDALGQTHLWLVLDEWSVVPLELQPYLADLLRRSVLPIRGITTKIAAIEHRTQFQLVGDHGDYVGIELGADASVDLNLDDFVVFDNDEEAAKQFFKNLLLKHFRAAAGENEAFQHITDADSLIGTAFTRRDAFEEYVRATEGVPRDAFYVLAQAAQYGFQDPISMPDIRKAAKTWYQRDKEAAVNSNPRAGQLLHKIVDDVIAHRRARAFLFNSTSKHPLIEELFDKRVLHVLKRGISSHDEPGVRYDVFKIDYGCYVDLLTTSKAPKGLLPFGDSDFTTPDETEYVEVPPDDYRAIRRAILRLDD